MSSPLTDEDLRNRLNAWDPLLVHEEPGGPEDEYDDLLAPLQQRLAAEPSRQELSSYLDSVLTENYGLDTDRIDIESFVRSLL